MWSMIGELKELLTPEEAQIQVAMLTGASAVIVSLIGIIGAKLFTHPKTPKRDPDENRNKNQSLLATYTGEQNEFIRMVIADSKDLHEKLDTLGDRLEAMKRDRQMFIGAVGRYINKLVAAWGSGGKMPYPDNDDMSLLEETLPADWRRRTK